jgi:gliding motility-associated-like protein
MYNLQKIILLIVVFLSSYSYCNAQIVGGDVFMQGNFIEVGLGQCGNFGTATLPPASGPIGPYHLNTSLPVGGTILNGLGFIADSGADGWADYCGDYFVPGTPVEGWSVCYKTSLIAPLTCAINTDQGCTTGGITGSNTTYSPPSGVCTLQAAEWVGSVGPLSIKQTVLFGIDDIFFTINIELCNNTADTIYDVYYARNVDPDNDAQQFGDYTTTNTILGQTYLGDPFSKVEAISPSGCGVSLFSEEPNSAVSYGGFTTENANMYWPTTVGTVHQFAGTNTNDEAISLGLNWVKLAPFQCVTSNIQYTLVAGLIPSNAFNYDADACEGDTLRPDIDSVNFSFGGTFSFGQPFPTDGAIIDSVTGIILDAIGGTDYNVVYTTPPPCPPIKFYATVHVSHCCGCDGGLYAPIPVYNLCVDSPSTASVGPPNVVGNNITLPFQQKYALTTPTGDMLAVNATGIFNGLTPGNYCIYSFNILTTDPDIPVGGIIPANFPTIDSLESVINTVDGVEKKGTICADLLTNCLPVKVSEALTAGIDASKIICLGDDSLLFLKNMITNEDVIGLWTDISTTPLPAGKFNPVLATVNPIGVPTGTYKLQYQVFPISPCLNDVSVVTLIIDHTPNFAGAGLPYHILINTSTVLNGSGGVDFEWTPDYNIENSNTQNPTVTPLVNTTYSVSVTNANGCADTASIRIFVDDPNILIPNAFSPDGDDINDMLRAIYIGMEQIDYFRIFNRWGEKVFETTDMTIGWDGKLNGIMQPMGTYIYQVSGRSIPGKIITQNGNITLLR